MFEIKDKVALITGASGGLGDKIARTLHAQGASLALTDRNPEKMEKLKQELGTNVECFVADLSNSEAISQLVKDVEEKFGHIDIDDSAQHIFCIFIHRAGNRTIPYKVWFPAILHRH